MIDDTDRAALAKTPAEAGEVWEKPGDLQKSPIPNGRLPPEFPGAGFGTLPLRRNSRASPSRDDTAGSIRPSGLTIIGYRELRHNTAPILFI
jgi:hypothetical protein